MRYALRNISLLCSSSSIYRNLIVYSMMLSLSTSSSEMVVNLIEVFILLFYFFKSSSSFCKFLKAILREVDSVVRTLISLLDPSLFFWGSSSTIFCNRTISFSRFIFLVFSLRFSLERLLIWSWSDTIYFSAWCCLVDEPPYPKNCCWPESSSRAKCFSEPIVFYGENSFTFTYWALATECSSLCVGSE